MRLFHPVPIVTRRAVRYCQVGSELVRAGSLVFIPVYAIHRHQSLWETPDVFDPDRFRTALAQASACWRWWSDWRRCCHDCDLSLPMLPSTAHPPQHPASRAGSGASDRAAELSADTSGQSPPLGCRALWVAGMNPGQDVPAIRASRRSLAQIWSPHRFTQIKAFSTSNPCTSPTNLDPGSGVRAERLCKACVDGEFRDEIKARTQVRFCGHRETACLCTHQSLTQRLLYAGDQDTGSRSHRGILSRAILARSFSFTAR